MKEVTELGNVYVVDGGIKYMKTDSVPAVKDSSKSQAEVLETIDKKLDSMIKAIKELQDSFKKG